jgi:UDP-N-acetylglucosamine:LPS N-acetylglucosamine transferase
VIPYADPDTLNRLLQKAEYVVCRAGYSTIMDLLILGKKGIYIPTPGQTEQQYLAKRLMQQHWGFCFEQEEADYISLLEKADTFNYSLPKLETTDARQHLKRTQQNWEIR